MKNKKRLLKIAKFCYKQSLTGGFVDYQKVRKTLKRLSLQKVVGLRAILRAYKRLIEVKLKKEEVTVEIVEKITNFAELETEIRQKTGVRKVTFRINPKITFGARITHGDWIWDSTLSSRLRQIAGNV
ncbi:hypothetical protein A2697_04170 [Candidatus Curtissbacteria bacterium RIFCSPHIGHO2_01_FULL_41_44]|uniref:Uncharacterized protein n=1 Tax=Candidatus Curtissbacteria bacterium RIFCSPLOWO2_01_FULL_42_50 TaxID=1797730 RepID=A0A1F5H2W7_9BACT|nr:MAG: hypothetical protein A3C33_04110 [Candidatus Curtissbacteria bacterium RIFCSPHIGHO2_02_FULL_42_58]OGD93759.1 MAG: hypothetical protein A2697_04170 [Candidatus Curtissbacteria bacterium RIFCSPHIGHO2_01_FULL_41_44]OGD97257.1 MAG: hypothetical protein A3E71_04320 [Candidatus Curtissbacteria bacterium RIFCSPHIGHO2_12_FULL_42_33]OGD98419.1 MAG: hypothetical protein A3B54_03730 [Candidatus Curtissbacteria bacterium RIFCSPLOWO2_01_FULL_42_50]OGE02336.1 MAG: hypothetical protein A3G16_03865 [Ca